MKLLVLIATYAALMMAIGVATDPMHVVVAVNSPQVLPSNANTIIPDTPAAIMKSMENDSDIKLGVVLSKKQELEQDTPERILHDMDDDRDTDPDNLGDILDTYVAHHTSPIGAGEQEEEKEEEIEKDYGKDSTLHARRGDNDDDIDEEGEEEETKAEIPQVPQQTNQQQQQQQQATKTMEQDPLSAPLPNYASSQYQDDKDEEVDMQGTIANAEAPTNAQILTGFGGELGTFLPQQQQMTLES